MPRGLVLVIGVLVIGFLFSMARTVRSKSVEMVYKRVDSGGNGSYGSVGSANNATTSYQNPASDHYAILDNNQKVLTYCVIDGRLVDS